MTTIYNFIIKDDIYGEKLKLQWLIYEYEDELENDLFELLNETINIYNNFDSKNDDHFFNLKMSLCAIKKMSNKLIRYDNKNYRNTITIYNEIYYRRKRIIEYCTNNQRSVLYAMGNFKDSLPPSLIQKLLTWMKRVYIDDKLLKMIRLRKEEIISKLEAYGYRIDINLIFNFLDATDNPRQFSKEFNVSNYNNGKKIKNSDIRQLLKDSLYNRYLNYRKTSYLSNTIRGMPNNVEELIRDFVY